MPPHTGTADPRLRPIAEVQALSRAQFEHACVAAEQPLVLRGQVQDWPLVRAAQESPEAFCTQLLTSDSGQAVDAVLLPPDQQGRLGYNPQGDGFNFVRQAVPLQRVIEQLVRYSHFDRPPSVAVQSASLEACAPALAATHRLALLDATVAPRLWLGNAVVTPVHFDESHNLACVVAGTRRFTLFPPEQVVNLYPGPPLFAPTGTPIGLADLVVADHHRFPRLDAALAQAQVATLAPGDAIYIPPLWWHHVESLDPLNALINHWWRPADEPSALTALVAALHAIGHQPAARRQAWAAVFGHYLFSADDRAQDHWPPALSQQARDAIKRQIPS